jgi:ligand-binding SRPBCC domain-containing protein
VARTEARGTGPSMAQDFVVFGFLYAFDTFFKEVDFVPVVWESKILEVKKHQEFVDVQIRGPYRHWHHRHLFKNLQGSVEMIDAVHYELPFGKLGKLLAKSLVEKRLNTIFDYREKKVREIFPGSS